MDIGVYDSINNIGNAHAERIFFDTDNRLEYLTENGDILPNLKKLVPRGRFLQGT